MISLQHILLVLLVAAGVYTVVVPSLLQGAIGLALTSVILSIIIFQFNAPFAAMFELSVCAGLITVVFVSAISLTRRADIATEREDHARHLRRFRLLPLLVVLAGAGLLIVPLTAAIPTAFQTFASLGVREALWEVRRFDMTGQLLLILSGVFGVVVLFKSWNSGEAGRQ